MAALARSLIHHPKRKITKQKNQTVTTVMNENADNSHYAAVDDDTDGNDEGAADDGVYDNDDDQVTRVRDGRFDDVPVDDNKHADDYKYNDNDFRGYNDCADDSDVHVDDALSMTKFYLISALQNVFEADNDDGVVHKNYEDDCSDGDDNGHANNDAHGDDDHHSKFIIISSDDTDDIALKSSPSIGTDKNNETTSDEGDQGGSSNLNDDINIELVTLFASDDTGSSSINKDKNNNSNNIKQ
jgi:hypothetical protein